MAGDIRRVGVAGCGTMGAGIAIVTARAGFGTVMYDTSPETLERARGQIEGFLAKSVQRGKLSRDAAAAALRAMTVTTDIAGLRGGGLVIEAVYDDLAAKQELFAKLDALCPPHTILATNTSTLS